MTDEGGREGAHADALCIAATLVMRRKGTLDDAWNPAILYRRCCVVRFVPTQCHDSWAHPLMAASCPSWKRTAHHPVVCIAMAMVPQ